MRLEKIQVSCRITPDIYKELMEFVGEEPGKPYRKIADYLYDLIVSDLNARSSSADKKRLSEFVTMLHEPEVQYLIKEIVSK